MIDHLRDVPADWLENNMDRLAEVYEKIKELYWVRWEGGYRWAAGKQPPKKGSNYGEWQRPTYAQVVERAAIFAGVHKTTKPTKGNRSCIRHAEATTQGEGNR